MQEREGLLIIAIGRVHGIPIQDGVIIVRGSWRDGWGPAEMRVWLVRKREGLDRVHVGGGGGCIR